MTKHFTRRVVAGAATAAIAASLVATGGGAAFADTAFGASDQTDAKATTNLLTTYGVRAGSAGGDYLGITNTNYDFTAGSASATTQYTGYTSKGVDDDSYLGISIWGTSVNESPNPYYWNHIYNRMTGSAATQATTWMSNPGTSSWGDSNGYTDSDSKKTAGMDFGGPDIVFGASKTANWSTNDQSGTNFYKYDEASTTWNPTYVNNDATNIWTQVYTEGQLATAADASSKTKRYGTATASALSYEKAIRGNMLYIASKIDTDQNVSKKKVAYLYAIDGDGAAYFFTPTADGLLKGDDAGASDANSVSNPDSNYAANNSTINMGYMGTLPFITDTFTGKDADEKYLSGCSSNDITMKVEDIYKSSPVVKVTKASALSGVDVIIYNTNDSLTSAGTSGGKNSTGVVNEYTLDSTVIANWFGGSVPAGTTLLAGDDFGTSTKQGDQADQAPTLYCQRNYTMDKNARAAWAFAKVYPELYGGNSNATYAYWLNNVYHVKAAYVPAVGAKLTSQKEADFEYTASESDTTTFTSTETMIENAIEEGYQWWLSENKNSTTWDTYAYYTGSSRASYYSDSSNNEKDNEIGIFAPSTLWKSATHKTADSSSSVEDATSIFSLFQANAEVYTDYLPACKLITDTDEGTIDVYACTDEELQEQIIPQDTSYLTSYMKPGVFSAIRGKSIGPKYFTPETLTLTFKDGVTDISALSNTGVDFSYMASNGLKTLNISISKTVKHIGTKAFEQVFFKGVTTNITFEGLEDGTSELQRIDSFAFTCRPAQVVDSSANEAKIPAAADVDECAFSVRKVSDEAPYTSEVVSLCTVTTVGKTVAEKQQEAVDAAKAEQKASDEAAQLQAIQAIYPDAKSLSDVVAAAKADQLAEDKASVKTLSTQAISLTTSKTYKAKKVKKKAQSFKVASAKGKLTVKKLKGSKKLTVKSGKVTVKKGTKKGVYTAKVSVSAAATSAYAAASTTATITVVVK